MNGIEFTVLASGAALMAGLLGAITGLGGGIIIVPLLALGFGVDLRYAVGASVVSVIATSSGSAATFVRAGIPNLRIGMFLEIATTLGAVMGTFIASSVSPKAISIVFGLFLLCTSLISNRARLPESRNQVSDGIASRLRLNRFHSLNGGTPAYPVSRVPLGFLIMFASGALSGLLGIGSGALKVLALDEVMRLPFKVSTTTSNFMIGVTAAASACVYLVKGYIDPTIAMPVMLGALAGSTVGARILVRSQTQLARMIFSLVVAMLGLEMIYSGTTGKF